MPSTGLEGYAAVTGGESGNSKRTSCGQDLKHFAQPDVRQQEYQKSYDLPDNQGIFCMRFGDAAHAASDHRRDNIAIMPPHPHRKSIISKHYKPR